MTDLIDGSIEANFVSLQKEIQLVHINELWNEYPWTRLFELLQQANYDGFCLAEIPESPEAIRLMRYYHTLWLALAGGSV